MNELLAEAEKENRAVGAFSVGNMEMILGVLAGAEAAGTPVILQIAEVRLKHSPLELIGPMMLAAASASPLKIAVHLDHGLSLETIQTALDLGFTSVMFDGSSLPFPENLARTKEIAALAHKYGAAAEAELGIVGGNEGDGASLAANCTDPNEAERFAAETGIDALAVAIGNAHGRYRQPPKLRFDVLDEIARRTKVPLVLHGGSGIPPEDFRRAIHMGIRKVNIATAGFEAITCAAKDYLTSAEAPSYFGLNEAMTAGVRDNVLRHLNIFGKSRESETTE